MKTYTDAEKLLTSSGKFRISLGLERIKKILEILGNPQNSLQYIHIAGTNGKGSVCSILSAILIQSGKKTGLYTSPHIFKYNERIKINGKNISDEDFAHYVFSITDIAQKNNIDLTEFEILTAVMFKYFYDNGVDIVVMETGLGGRYDATNVIEKPLCSIITHVDLDHTERLGNTIEKIAYEKAGIMKKDSPCIVFEGLEVYKDYADEIGAMLILITPFADTTNLSLKGMFQQENLSLAKACINEVFPEISENTIEEGIKKVKHPCRFQYIEEKNIIIDSAHNPNGITALKQSLDMYFPTQKRRFIFGCLKNKDYNKMTKILFNPDDEVYFCEFSHQNSCKYEDLNKIYPKSQKFVNADIIKKDKLNIICGSIYMLSEIIPVTGLETFIFE